jgi:hypothetical protein
MKTLKILLASTLLLSVPAMALTSKVKEPTKKVYSVLEGTTVNQVAKPGLAVDLSYTSQHVEVGELSDINVTLLTSLSKGILKVKIKALDTEVDGVAEQNLEFDLSQGDKSFPIHLQLSSESSGIHYINFTLSVDGEGSRVLVVPFNVGTISSKVENKAPKTTNDGTVISVSSAEEEIK